MIRKQSAEEQIATMHRLMNYGMNESAKKSSAPVVEFKRKAADGKTYGIIREASKFYIMQAPEKDTEVLAEDFNYIGGFNNRRENEYSSYAKASNALDLKIMSINESVAKENRVVISEPVASAEWGDTITESMRKEIDRFKSLTSNMNTILRKDNTMASMLREDKGIGAVPSAHTLPEAPAKNPSEKQVNAPFTDTAVANGEKDFTKEEHNHETAGGPFNEKATVNMESDKKPSIKTGEVYSEKAKYTPEGAVANQHPSGAKAVKMNEGKIRLKLTEAQVLAWNDAINHMDTSKGTEIGDTAPYDEKVACEGTECQVNEDVVAADDAAGFDGLDDTMGDEDYSDFPYPDVAKEMYGDEEEEDLPEIEEPVDDEFEFDVDMNVDAGDEEGLANLKGLSDKGGKSGMKGLENWKNDWDKFEDDDFGGGYYEESKKRNGKVVESKLDVFGKHPAYQKTPMTTPPNKEVAINGAREWDDESAQGEEPFGQQIGDSAPYSQDIVSAVVESVYSRLFKKKS